MSKPPTKGGKVGPGAPPKHSQFRKGQSGNPAGRPKGRPNLQTIIDRTLQTVVTVDKKGRRVTLQEALITSLAQQGVKGKYQATELLFRLASAGEKNGAQGPSSEDLITPDKEMLRRIKHRLDRLLIKKVKSS